MYPNYLTLPSVSSAKPLAPSNSYIEEYIRASTVKTFAFNPSVVLLAGLELTSAVSNNKGGLLCFQVLRNLNFLVFYTGIYVTILSGIHSYFLSSMFYF